MPQQPPFLFVDEADVVETPVALNEADEAVAKEAEVAELDALFAEEALDADVENLLKPVKTVGNFFKKAMGQEVPPSAEPSKRRLWLDKKMSERRELAKQEKERLAQEKRQKQEEERRKRQEQFALKKQQRLNKKNQTKDETNGAGTK